MTQAEPILELFLEPLGQRHPLSAGIAEVWWVDRQEPQVASLVTAETEPERQRDS